MQQINPAETIWNNCLNFIKDNIPDEAFATWFEPINALKLTDNVLTVEVPSKFFYEWLEDNYMKLMRSALRKELGPDAKLVYSIVMKKQANGKSNYSVKIPSNSTPKVKTQEVNAPLNMESHKVKNPFVIPGLQKMKIDSQLNPNYTFDNFVEGETNRLARSAGSAIAKRPGGTAFNPLFIFGGVGLGKTHLVNAIGLKVKENHPDKTVLYVSAEKFIQQFVDSVRANNSNDFVHFYQLIDVLIIDDVEFFAGKKKTQDAFFHIFNHLHQRGNQIIMTSDKPPGELPDMEKRLISRFKWGLSADIQKPDYETRMSILKQKVESDGISISNDVLRYIAQNIHSNIRELEGALISLIAQSSLNKKELSVDLAEKVLSNLIVKQNQEISIDKIKEVVCEYFKIPLDDVMSKSRKRDIVQVRHLAMYFSKQFTQHSLSHIGENIGNRDHATVLHACRSIKNLLETDKKFKSHFEDIRKRIKEY